ncbi:MAG: LysE family transporter [Parachlamydia sp.]|nr:LysE family transporter [Parachlamydia sp.]
MFACCNFFAVGVISLIAAISPGPNFCIVLRNSLSYSRKGGLMTAFGISLGSIVHLFYTLVGIGILIQKSPALYQTIKYIGAAYLFYLGLTVWISSFKNSGGMNLDGTGSVLPISSLKALSQGFLTTILNPRAALFYISLFSQFIQSSTPFAIKIAYAFINWSVTLGWFLLLVFLLTGQLMMSRIDRFRLQIDRAIGGILMVMSMILLLT